MVFNSEALIRDRYKVKQSLGSGGWGVTYLVTDLQAESPNDARCVVKQIIQSPHLTSKQNLDYFNNEVRALQHLGTHSQIPSFRDSFDDEEYFYIIQEYIEGNELSQRIPEQRLTEIETIQLLTQILKVVQFIHNEGNGYVHQDLKPNNIIERPNGEIVIIDFGTVKEISTLSITKLGDSLSLVIGAEPYIAPERGRCGAFDQHPRIDIYSIGIIGLQAITGLDTRYLHIDPHNSGARLWSNAYEINPKMKDILCKMAHYNHEIGCRYQNVGDVLEELKELERVINREDRNPESSNDEDTSEELNETINLENRDLESLDVPPRRNMITRMLIWFFTGRWDY